MFDVEISKHGQLSASHGNIVLAQAKKNVSQLNI